MHGLTQTYTHNVFDCGFKSSLGLFHCIFSTDDCNDLSIVISVRRENYPGTSGVSDFFNIGTVFTNKEFVVLSFGTYLKVSQ